MTPNAAVQRRGGSRPTRWAANSSANQTGHLPRGDSLVRCSEGLGRPLRLVELNLDYLRTFRIKLRANIRDKTPLLGFFRIEGGSVEHRVDDFINRLARISSNNSGDVLDITAKTFESFFKLLLLETCSLCELSTYAME